MVAGYACGLDFSPEMSYLCRSLKQTSSEQMMRCGNYCVLLKFQFSLQWRWWRQGVHLGLEDHKVVVEVEGAWRCLHSGNLLFRSVLTLNYKTLLFTCSPHFTLSKLIPTCRCCGTPTRPARWPLLGGMAWSSSGIEILQTYLMAKVCAKAELVELP